MLARVPALAAALSLLACGSHPGAESPGVNDHDAAHQDSPVGAVAVMDASSARDSAQGELDAELVRVDAGSQVPGHCGFSDGKLDLLLLVDNSGSMAAEQELLARELPKMIRALASGDVNGDGEQDHPKADLHVGVISTDMGLSGLAVDVPQCTRLGDDGLLRTPPSCGLNPRGYLSRATEDTLSVDAFGDAVGCLTRLGAKGCGMEQHLEAVLKALTPGSADVRFAFGTDGHGDGANQGFLRSDSVLAVIIVSDEDDCSFSGESAALVEAADPADASVHPGPAASLNYRCQAQPELLYPVSRYVDQLRSLRSANPGSFFFAVIGGVPTGLALSGQEIANVLADPRMAFRPRTDKEATQTAPEPACTASRSGLDGGTESVEAIPARRLLEVAEAFGERAVIGSICEPTFTRSVEAIAKRIGGVLACPEAPILF